MKTIFTLVLTSLFLFFNSFPASAQQQRPNPMVLALDSYPLSIAHNKTTNLVFPYAIKSVDKGSNAVQVQLAKGLENILQVKAAEAAFDETNLTVVTAQGKLYSFLLNFQEHPSELNLVFRAEATSLASPTILLSGPNELALARDAQEIASKKKSLSGIQDKKHGMVFSLEGIYIQEHIMHYRIKIENQSNIHYELDQIRFFIRDQKQSKRTASQEIELSPLYVHHQVKKVEGQSSESSVYALPSFTIPDKKYLILQVMERNGGRHLEVKVSNKTLVRSSVLKN